MTKRGIAAIAASMFLMTSVAGEAKTLKIGLLMTLSGPLGTIGQHARDGFVLAVKQRGGKLGGLETRVIVSDDELKPLQALSRTRQFLERDKVDFVVGMIASNVLHTVIRPVTERGTFLIGVNAGTSMFAGEKCNPFFFSTSFENEQVPEAVSKHAQDMGYRRIVTLAPDFQAGRNATAGFTRNFKGEVSTKSTSHLNSLTSRPSWRASARSGLMRFSPSCPAPPAFRCCISTRRPGLPTRFRFCRRGPSTRPRCRPRRIRPSAFTALRSGAGSRQ